MKLSKAQMEILKSALRFDGIGGRVQYQTARDTSMWKLQEYGFSYYDPAYGQTYGRAHWYITDAGMTKAKELFPDEAAKLEEWQRS